jgi:cystic fibrosis transmembrane conductance regulator
MIYLFGIITTSLTLIIPTSIKLFVDVRGALQRIEMFLKATEYPQVESVRNRDEEDITLSPKLDDGKRTSSCEPLPFVNLHDVTCELPSKMCRSSNILPQSKQGSPLLKNITLEVSTPELVLICGAVGSGKSSLLETILGEVLVTSGSVNYFGQLAYVSDTPWVFPGTIRQNIVFGLSYNESKYNKIIKACQLEKDFDTFPEHDLTRIGEHCASISGGQRTRIALARAVYSEADIYLLDDPLSSLDINVAENVFRLVIILILIVNTWIFNRSLKS